MPAQFLTSMPPMMATPFTTSVLVVWPGSGPLLEPAFYAYCVPEPPGLKTAPVQPAAAFYHAGIGEFILPYEAVRSATSPDAEIHAFIDSTYGQAATLAGWDRAALERAAANKR